MDITDLFLLVFSITFLLLIVIESLPDLWKVHKKGNVEKNSDLFGIVIIEKNIITRSLRAYTIVNFEKTAIEVEEAEKLIG